MFSLAHPDSGSSVRLSFPIKFASRRELLEKGEHATISASFFIVKDCKDKIAHLLVFSLTPFKIDQEKIKTRIWERRKICKAPRQDPGHSNYS